MEATALEMAGWTVGALEEFVGGLSKPSKMPGLGYGLPARECTTGSKLRKVRGSTCHGCYALKGHYMFATTQAAQYRRLAAINKPGWADAMAELIGRKCVRVPFFRWHDSGDLQSAEHFAAICQVAAMTPDVSHWLPTREYRIVGEYLKSGKTIPENLCVRMSAHMIGGQVPSFPAPLTVSSVSAGDDTYPDTHHCPSRFQGNSCGDCRACWDRAVSHVDYHVH